MATYISATMETKHKKTTTYTVSTTIITNKNLLTAQLEYIDIVTC